MSGLLLLCFSCSRYWKNFRIVDIGVRPGKFCYHTGNEQRDTSGIILEFKVKYTNCQTVIGGAIEPGIFGIESQIKRFEIFDATNRNITSEFKGIFYGRKYLHPVKDTGDFIACLNFGTIRELKDSINSRTFHHMGLYASWAHLFSKPKDLHWPLTARLYFENSDSLIERIEFKTDSNNIYYLPGANPF